MVFLTNIVLRALRGHPEGPCEFWRKRRILRMSAHFFGRGRNCYSIAVRYVHRAMRYATLGRKLKKADMLALYATRVQNAAEEVGVTDKVLSAGLVRSDILLTNHSLSDLAVWEPRSFKALANFAWHRSVQEGITGIEKLGDPPKGVILRGMVKK